jgi:integrase/recombinase XerD
MALVDKGTELIVVRDLLGHSSVQTTEIYAKLSNNRKREAIEGASQQIVNPEEPLWEANASLKEWLINLGKNRIMVTIQVLIINNSYWKKIHFYG